MTMASVDVEIGVFIDLCQRMLDGKWMSADRATSVAIPIFERRGDIMNCGMYVSVKLQGYTMKIVEEILLERLRKTVTIEDMQ